jgi:hypothetical protein
MEFSVCRLDRLAAIERIFDGPYGADLALDPSDLQRRFIGEAASARRFHLHRALRSLSVIRRDTGVLPADIIIADALAECRRAQRWQDRLRRLATGARVGGSSGAGSYGLRAAGRMDR